MPETFHLAFEAPVVATIGGVEVSFPVLCIDDYLPWCAELKAERKKAAIARIPANTPAFERFRMERQIDADDPWLDDIVTLARTPKGAKRILELSLTKAKRPAEEIAQILSAIPPYILRVLSEDVARLTPPLSGLAVPQNPPTAGQGEAGETGSPSNA